MVYQKCFDWGRPVKSEKSIHTSPQEVRGGAGWPRPSACVMAVGTRFYCPVHSFIVVIEMRAIQPTAKHTRRCVVFEIYACYNLLLVHIHLCVWLDDAPKMLRLGSYLRVA